ncbi:TIGR03643 family protein [Alteromonas halophila]|nr:TIGR03643 family protein [Alteromonas halophila]
MASRFNDVDTSRIIEMAWEDRTPFEAIERLFGLSEDDVIQFMRHQLKPKAFKNWRARVSGRKTKHRKLRSPDVERGYCPSQYKPDGAG